MAPKIVKKVPTVVENISSEESDAMEDSQIYPSTQQVYEEIERAALEIDLPPPAVTLVPKSKKRKSEADGASGSGQQKRLASSGGLDEMIAGQVPNAKGELSYLGMLIQLWDDDNILLVIIPRLKVMMKWALQEKEFDLKRNLYQMQQGITSTLKALKAAKIEFSPCSIKVFAKYLQGDALFTTFTKEILTPTMQDWIVEKYLEDFPEQRCSSVNIETTITSCTTAPTVTVPVDVPLVSISEKMPVCIDQEAVKEQAAVAALSDDAFLAELFPASSSTSTTGSISQSISKRVNDNLITYVSPGEFGYRVIKLDVYDFNKICNLPKDQWWKQANFRSTFLTSSAVDPKEMLVNRLLSNAAGDLKKIPNLRKEERGTKSFNSYNNGQQRQ